MYIKKILSVCSCSHFIIMLYFRVKNFLVMFFFQYDFVVEILPKSVKLCGL